MDYTVTLGDLITTLTALVAVVVAYVRLGERLAALEAKVEAMWDDTRRRRSRVEED